ECYRSRRIQIAEGLTTLLHDPPIVPDTCAEASVALEAPDQAPRQRAGEWVIEVALAPHVERPCFSLQVQLLDAVALGRQHLPDIGCRLGQLFEFLAMLLA